MRLFAPGLVLAFILSPADKIQAESLPQQLVGNWEATLERDLSKISVKSLPRVIGKPLSLSNAPWPWSESNKVKVSLDIDKTGLCEMTIYIAGKSFLQRQTWQSQKGIREWTTINIQHDEKTNESQIQFEDDNRLIMKGALIDSLFAASPTVFVRAGAYDVKSARRFLTGRWQSEIIVDEARARNILLNRGVAESDVDAKLAEQVKQLVDLSFNTLFFEDGRFETTARGKVANESKAEGTWKIVAFRRSQPPLFPFAELVYERRHKDGNRKVETLEIVDTDQLVTRRFNDLPIRAMVLRRLTTNRLANESESVSEKNRKR